MYLCPTIYGTNPGINVHIKTALSESAKFSNDSCNLPRATQINLSVSNFNLLKWGKTKLLFSNQHYEQVSHRDALERLYASTIYTTNELNI